MISKVVDYALEVLLKIPSNSLLGCRFVSHNYVLPHPRNYRRRVYEAAVAPIFSPNIREEAEILKENEALTIPPSGKQVRDDLDQYEEAEVKMLKNWIKQSEFRALGICQILHVNGPSLWMATNKFRLNGLHLIKYKPKTMHNLLRGTPFEALSVLFDEHTFVLFGSDLSCLKIMFNECSKYNWITLLAATFDDRILSVEDLKTLSNLHDIEQIRAETTQILSQVQNELVTNLESTSRELVKNFEYVASRN